MSGFKKNTSVENFGFVGNLSGVLNSVFEIENSTGANFIAFNIAPPTDAVIEFQLSFDGINFESFTLRSTKNDIFVNSANDIDTLLGSIINAKIIRFKTIIAGTGSGTITGTLNYNTATIESIEFGYPPHRFGYTPTHKDAIFSTAQTGTALWTPASGKKVVVTDLDVLVGGATDGQVSIHNGAGNVEGSRLFNAFIDVSTNKNFIYTKNFKVPYIGTVDGAIKITTSANISVSVVLHGYEI